MSEERNAESERAALAVLDEFLAALNAREFGRQAATLNYPHVRFAGGRVTIFATPAEFADSGEARIARGFEAGWHRSRWDERTVIHSSAEKVHLAVRFTRLDAAGAVLASYRSLYIVTRVDSHWGIQGRSSYAP